MAPPDHGAALPVTLIIPTVHHRAALFARTLRHLSSAGFQCPIVVSDHSPDQRIGIVADIARRERGLDLTVLQHSPDEHFLARLGSCASAARTPYVHLHADDDFLVAPGLTRLIQTIDERPDLAAAMGLNLHVVFASREVTVGPKIGIDGRNPFDRLVAQLETYSSVLYALRRKDEFVASLAFAVEHCPDVQFWQYLESCMTVLAGPIAVIDELHYVREVHDAKWSATLVRERSYDHFPYLVLSPEFHPRLAAFRAALIAACDARAISVDEDAIDAGLVHLLYRGLGIMGLPAKRISAADTTRDAAARLEAKLGDPSNPATAELNRIFALAKAEVGTA
jgi:glycosyltransferase domain-containing protein